jgi:beta-mannosidase
VERPEKLDAVLELARRAHVNLLRVNGVGVIERSDFYERCDRLGILVWQEFLVTSSEQDRKPSEDPGYLGEVVAEARGIVPRRRNHASLALWCAGNELESLEKLPLDDSEPLIAALRDVVHELDPDRLWLPTSPVGRKPFNGLSSIRRDPDGLHDVHGPWLYEGLEDQYTLYNETTTLFHSEFGVEGLTNLETLQALLPAEELDVARLDSPMWQHRSAWWVRPQLWREWLGEIDDLPALIRATQTLQAEGVRYTIESNRRRIPRNSGSLPWQFNEPYPMAACTSAIDYHARPKELYHAVEAAYRPLSVSARYDRLAWGGHTRFDAEVWVVSALAAPVRGVTVEARVIAADGAVAARITAQVDVDPGRPVRAGSIDCELAGIGHDVFFLDLRVTDSGGELIAENRVGFSRTADLAPLVSLPPTSLRVAIDDSAEHVRVANDGEVAALYVRAADARDARAAGHALPDSGGFCLLPGEEHVVAIEWHGVAPSARQVRVEGWNTSVASLAG